MDIIFILVTIFIISNTHTTLGCSTQERLALVKFKQSIEDELGMLSSWVGNECCRWEGVRCDVATGNVASLRLRGKRLKYLASDHRMASLGELRHLQYLDLSGINFQGIRIPEFIGSLKQLSYLNLSNANFGGVIPHHIGNLSNLQVLDLTSSIYQDLTVDDIVWLFRLPLLKNLDLSGVDLSGTKNLDKVLYMIPSLIDLRLSACRLSIDELGRNLNSSRELSNIKHLDLRSNILVNPRNPKLPVFLRNMTSLVFLDLSNSNLGFAWNLAQLLNMIPSLTELHLSFCQLRSNHLAPTHFNYSTQFNIQHLDFISNQIEGIFPSILTNMSSLKVLDLSGNLLNSSIPIMPRLVNLDISSNNFQSIENVGIWRQCHLKHLSVSSNDLQEEMIGPSINISGCSKYAFEKLYLDHNLLSGSIPESLGRLTRLRVLDLSGNRLTDRIPEALVKLGVLEVLDLSSNQLNGAIPTFISELASLQVLSVQSNLLNGTIPISIGRLNKVTSLDISGNYLEGMLYEDHFANLSMLEYLDVSSNINLAFSVSHEWMPPFQLRSLQLGSCKINGEFPHWLRTQRKINELVLSNTSISGPLPAWFSKMPIIQFLDLSFNKLNGTLMNLPVGETFIEFEHEYSPSLFLQNNVFSGSIPRSLCGRIDLQFIDLSRNRLTGKIPDCLENLQSLDGMKLSSNRLSGVIPSSIGHITSLSSLQLNENNFIGKLPQALWNLPTIFVLDLGDNGLSGNLPEFIEEGTPLMVLRLRNNNFTGNIPESLCKKQCLQLLDVANNSLRGTIPRCLGKLSGMGGGDYGECMLADYSVSGTNISQVLKGSEYEYTTTLQLVINMDLSSNELVGQIPEELMRLTQLVGLNLSRNHFNGSIPGNIGDLKALFSLDLSKNNLTGTIPQSLANLNFLSLLNLSHNNLSGPIPKGNQLQTLTDPSIYAANEYLCGAPLPESCSTDQEPTVTTSKKKQEVSDKPNKVWFYFGMVFGSATGFWGVIGILMFKTRWRYNLYKFSEVTMDEIYVAVAVRVAKMKRRRETA